MSDETRAHDSSADNSASHSPVFPGRFKRSLRVYAACGIAGLAVYGVAVRVAGQLGGFLDPVQFRVYLWENALFFLCLPLAVLAFVVLRILAANAYLRSGGPILAALYGATAAMFFVSFAGFQIVRPSSIVWTDVSAPRPATELRDGSAAAAPGPSMPRVNHVGDAKTGGGLWLPQIVSRARAQGLAEGRPVLYYLHADWCHSCTDFENYVLGSPFLQKDLEPFLKVRLDVTDIHRWQDYLDRKLGVSAVPSIIVRDRAGRIVPRPVIGENVSLRAVRSVLQAASIERAALVGESASH